MSMSQAERRIVFKLMKAQAHMLAAMQEIAPVLRDKESQEKFMKCAGLAVGEMDAAAEAIIAEWGIHE